MESVKICHFKTFRAGNFAFRTFCCFFLHYIHVKKFVCEDITAEYEFESGKFNGGTHRLKLNNLDLSGNTTEFKTLPTRQGFQNVFANGSPDRGREFDKK